MSKVLIYSDYYLPTFPYLELPLYHELEKRGIEVKYILHEDDIRLYDKDLRKVFSSLKGITTIRKTKQILALIDKKDLYVSRFAYKLSAGEVASLVRTNGKRILMYDPSGIDIRVRDCPAHYLTAKSESLKKATLKKFPNKYKEIIVTGTIHMDSIATTQVDRNSFMNKYGMNSAKKMAILTPANPGEAWMDGLKDDYKTIINTLNTKCPKYEWAFKLHPLDYLIELPQRPGVVHKGQHYNGKASWKELDPNAKVIKADEGYMALKACDIIVNIRSSIAMETAAFRKPLVNVNRSKYVTNWPFDGKIMYDIKMNQLEKFLNDGVYSIGDKECAEYVKKENHSDDGRAYIRTADFIEKNL